MLLRIDPSRQTRRMGWKRTAFDRGLVLVAALARSRHVRTSDRLTRALARFTLWVQGGRRVEGVEAVAAEWQRMFPSPRMVPVKDVRGDTAYAEIHANCPLRGTGDTYACHRMMEYDRHMLRAIGGRLVVLQSQAEPGRTVCEVALRTAEASEADLTPAHVRAPGGHA